MSTITVSSTADDVEIKDLLKRYYVYALVDTRNISNGGIFYIGKGTANRAEAHGKEALKLEKLKTEEDEQAGSEKLKRIAAIRKSGKEPLVRVLARFDTEPEAFAAEAILIQCVYGRLQDGGQLTNIVLGHNSRHIRHRDNFEEIPRLDIPKTTRMVKGEYTASTLERLRKNSVWEKAEEAVEELRAMIAADSRLKNRVAIADPAIAEKRYVAAVVNFGESDVILRLQFTPTGLIINLRAPAEGTKASRSGFAERMRSVGLEPANKVTSYGWLPGWANNPLKFNEFNLALARITEAFNKFKGKPIRATQ